MVASASLYAASTTSKRASRAARLSRAVMPILLHWFCNSRSAFFCSTKSVIGRSFSISVISALRFSRFAPIVTSRFSRSAFLAAKKVSCEALKRAQSFVSSLIFPRPAAFQASIRALKRRAVATQSVEVASASASATNFFLASDTTAVTSSRDAKCVRRRLSNLFREDEKRFQRSVSVFLSNRGADFHSSSSAFRRSPVTFQLVESLSDSASATIFSFSINTCAKRSALTISSAAFLAS